MNYCKIKNLKKIMLNYSIHTSLGNWKVIALAALAVNSCHRTNWVVCRLS